MRIVDHFSTAASELEEELDYSQESIIRIIAAVCQDDQASLKELLSKTGSNGDTESATSEFWNAENGAVDAAPAVADESGKEAIAKALMTLEHDDNEHADSKSSKFVLRKHEQFYMGLYSEVSKDSWGPLEYAVYFGREHMIQQLLDVGFGRVYLERQRKQERAEEVHVVPHPPPIINSSRKPSFASLSRQGSRQGTMIRNSSRSSTISASLEPQKPRSSGKFGRRWGRRRKIVGHDTPLHWSAYNGNVNMLCTFLNYGFSPSIVDTTGNTPLHLAASAAIRKKGNHLHVAQVLISEGAPLQQRNWFGHTPLAMASTKQIKKLIRAAVRGKLEFSSLLSRIGIQHYVSRLKEVQGLLEMRMESSCSDELTRKPSADGSKPDMPALLGNDGFGRTTSSDPMEDSQTKSVTSEEEHMRECLHLHENQDAIETAAGILQQNYRGFVPSEHVLAVEEKLHQLQLCVNLQDSICTVTKKRPLTSGRQLRCFYECIDSLREYGQQSSAVLCNMAMSTFKVAEKLKQSCELEIGVSQSLVPTAKVRAISNFNTRVVETLRQLLDEAKKAQVPLHSELLKTAHSICSKSSSILLVLRSANEEAEVERIEADEAAKLAEQKAAQAQLEAANAEKSTKKGSQGKSKSKKKGKSKTKSANEGGDQDLRGPTFQTTVEQLSEEELTKKFEDHRARVTLLRESLYCLFPFHELVLLDKQELLEAAERAKWEELERNAEEERIRAGVSSKGKKKKKKKNEKATKKKESKPTTKSVAQGAPQLPKDENLKFVVGGEPLPGEAVEQEESVVPEDVRERAFQRFTKLKVEFAVLSTVHAKMEAKRQAELKLQRTQQLKAETQQPKPDLEPTPPKKGKATGKPKGKGKTKKAGKKKKK